MKINAIVFSKDRASQLYLFLNSIEKNAKDIFDLKVVYTYSNDEFKKGYDKLQELCKNASIDVSFVKETASFKQDVLNLLNLKYQFTTFFTDDDVLFDKVDYETIEKSFKNESVFCFSLRLGMNTTFCYTMSQNNKLVISEETDDTIIFDWQKSYMDYGYPLSVDGHVFRTKEIAKLSKAISFNSPNTFEGNLQIYETFPRHMMESYKKSKLVGIPVNIVNSSHPNLNGQKFKFTTKDLNDKFLSDTFIDLNKIDFSNIIGAHQEVEYKF